MTAEKDKDARGGGGTRKSRRTGGTSAAAAPGMTVRARRRREEAVRRLVADVQSKATALSSSSEHDPNTNSVGVGGATTAAMAETHDWLVASAVATALEKGLDRDLHAELIQEAKDNAGRIGQVCHDHADVFLQSVAQVAALATPSADLAEGIQNAQSELRSATTGPMHEAATAWEEARQSYARARTVTVMVDACQSVAIQMERARKQAALGRPRAALDAVDRARTALTTPVESLFQGPDEQLWKETVASEMRNNTMTATAAVGSAADKGASSITAAAVNASSASLDLLGPSTTSLLPGGANSSSSKKLSNLEQTPFGKRAILFLPKIETEVLLSARRGLNRWLLALRSGDAAKAGRAAIRETAHAAAAGPGALGLGGSLPASFLWRAQMAENWMARTGQATKVARACRLGYYFDRDAVQDAEKLQNALLNSAIHEGSERYVEAIAVAMGWYRCWEDGSALLVDPFEYLVDGGGGGMDGSSRGTGASRHGLSGSRHGLSGNSRHGLRASRHGPGSATKKSLGFRASTNSRSQAYQETMTSALGTAAGAGNNKVTIQTTSLWTELLLPNILLSVSPTRKEEDDMLRSLPESVHPVRRAELAYNLLEKSEEFVRYYEQNRFGEMKIGGEGKDAIKSALSSLTGDDVSLGSDRTFFSKTLSHLCATVVGFSAIESALELSNFNDDVESDMDFDISNNGAPNNASASRGLQPSRFRESSERYERLLVAELGQLIRSRCDRANLGELVRTTRLLVSFRAAMKLVHPSSNARRFDKELLALDSDLPANVIKIAQDEMLKASMAIVDDDQKVPMLVSEALSSTSKEWPKSSSGVPDPEEVGLPFGLSSMKQTPQQAELEFQEHARTSYNQAPMDAVFTFSHSVPVILRAIHARAIACAAFALCQTELCQKLSEKKGSAASAFVLDCVEQCIGAAVIGMKDSDNVVVEGSVDKAVQVMANISALQHSLPRFFATVLRGLFHIGLVRADEVEETFAYSEKALKAADKSCDAQVGGTYSLVYEICRTKIDSQINMSLDNFNWVAKSFRESPNPYCDALIGYLRTVFAALGPMDEGSRAGLHFSCCGHISERLAKMLSGKPGDTATLDDSGLPPISKIDAYGLSNLSLDCEELERFADSTAIPSLRDCFSELRILTSFLLDKELPNLILPENVATRRRKYPMLSLEKVGNVLEKYVGSGMFGGTAGRNSDVLFIEKKEVVQLLKIVRSQV